MEKKEIGEKKILEEKAGITRQNLDVMLEQVDDIIMHKYLSELSKKEILPTEVKAIYDEKENKNKNETDIVVGTNINLAKLERVVYDKDENVLDKLANVYNATALYESATLVMILKSDENGIDIYIGTIAKKTDDMYAPRKQIQALVDNFKANFPGSKLKRINSKEERKGIVQDIFSQRGDLAVAAVTGIASLKNEENMDNTKYVQGFEKLTDSLKGKTCTILIIADPVENDTKNMIRAGYEEIYTSLKPFEQSVYTINESNGKTITDSIMKGVSDATTKSLAKTKTVTKTTGTNSANTVGGSIGTSVNQSVGASVGNGVASVSSSVSVGVNTSVDYHHTSGKHEDRSNATGDIRTEGTSQTLSEQNSIANALSENNGEGLQLNYENRSVKSILEKIDLQLERVVECENYGMYDCGVYFLSEEYATCLSVASTYKSIVQGEKSSAEVSHINIWNDREKVQDIISYLSIFSHPIFKLDSDRNPIQVTASTLVSGRELAIFMGLPKKSISGIPVVDCAAFGRNVLYTYGVQQGAVIDLGKIHHMYEDENTNVLLHKKSFTSHAFVTGSTGAGKSNAIYHLINELCDIENKDAETHFMVIEPAKGEYKDVFGGYENVEVLGTNPKLGKLLRINPFSFPDGIHVLEHIDRLVEIFNVCWPMYAAMPAVLKEAVERAYEAAGWDLSSSNCLYRNREENIYPNFVDVLKQINQVITESKYSSDSKGDYVGALSMRISSLTNGINGQILSSNELTYEQLFDQNVIVDLSRVGSSETKALLMGLLIIKLQEYRMSSAIGSNSELKHITILEEAHNILKRTSTEQSVESANLGGKSVEMLANAIAEMRTYGEGFIIADQAPGLMDMSVIRNTNTKIILRLPDISDRELVGKAANLSDTQIAELAKLKTGVCAVYQNNWIEPVLCHITEWDNSKSKKLGKKEETTLENSIEIKKKIVKLVLQPMNNLKEEGVERIIDSINKTKLSTELRIKLLKMVAEKDVEKYRKLRQDIIYEVFDPDIVLDRNLYRHGEIEEWYNAMQEELIPHIDEFSEDERKKILAILVMEKGKTEKTSEYIDLINNLLVFIDNKGRRL